MSRVSLSIGSMLRRRPVPARSASSTSTSTLTYPSALPSGDPKIFDNGDSQTLRLQSGRTLGFATYGPETGYPLLFFHGFPSSRLEGSVLLELARKRHVRVISIDRPGFGLSSFQAQRRITDWPVDVAAIVQHLELKQYSILGGSGGGPFALACAYALPKEQLASVGLFASAGPWAAGTKDMPLESRALGWLGNRYPRVLQGLMTALVGTLRWLLHTRLVTRWLDRGLQKDTEAKEGKEATWTNETAPSEESAPLVKASEPTRTIEERRKRLLRMLLEAFAQGTAGLVQEAQLLSSLDWGFRFEDVDYPKVQIWHGTKDSRSPIGQIRYMAERLPRAELVEFEDKGHFDMAYRMKEALDQLVAGKQWLG